MAIDFSHPVLPQIYMLTVKMKKGERGLLEEEKQTVFSVMQIGTWLGLLMLMLVMTTASLIFVRL